MIFASRLDHRRRRYGENALHIATKNAHVAMGLLLLQTNCYNVNDKIHEGVVQDDPPGTVICDHFVYFGGFSALGLAALRMRQCKRDADREVDYMSYLDCFNILAKNPKTTLFGHDKRPRI
jgi:hypothetical protein